LPLVGNLSHASCRIGGDKILVQADIAWDESWAGTEQVRRFRLEGDELHIEAVPQPLANFGVKMLRAMLVRKRGELDSAVA
jgi:hypothetical protein